GPRAAKLGRGVEAQQAKLRHLGDVLRGPALLLVELRGERAHVLLRKLAHRLPDQLLLGGRLELHGAARGEGVFERLAAGRLFASASLSPIPRMASVRQKVGWPGLLENAESSDPQLRQLALIRS